MSTDAWKYKCFGGLIIRAKKIHFHIQVCITHTFFTKSGSYHVKCLLDVKEYISNQE